MQKKSKSLKITIRTLLLISCFASLNFSMAQPKETLYYTVFKDNKFTNYQSQNQVSSLLVNSNLLDNSKISEYILEVYPQQPKHSVVGFGGSVTDACISNINGLSPKAQKTIFKELFGKTHGARLNFLRLPIGANDFSSSDYSFDEVPQGQTDPQFKKLDFSPAQPQIDFIKTAKNYNPQIQLMASPWSPPAWMKDTEKLRGGQILPQFYASFAEYLAQTSLYMKSKKLPIKFITILNEPLIGWAKESWGFAQTYMGVDDQYSFTKDHLIPTFERMGVKTKILVHDHNWDNSEGTIQKFNDLLEQKNPGLAGVAFHCYGGNYESQKSLLDKYKGTQFINSECSSTLRENNHAATFQWWLRTQSLDSIQAGSSGALAWNLCLDQDGGPRNNGCRGCRGLLTIDSKSKAVTLNPEYLALKQVSKFVYENAVVVDHKFTTPTELSALTVINTDGSRAYVIRNPTLEFVKVNISQLKNTYLLPPQSALSIKK